MSFQDFGRNASASNSKNNSSNNRPGRSGPPGSKSAVPLPPSSGNSAASGNSNASDGGLGQISESLLQYQRNVGILEKIVQSLMAKSNSKYHSRDREELEVQFKAQVDVLAQLQDRVAKQVQAQRQQISATTAAGSISETKRTTLVKLQRDFERVVSRAVSLQESVARLRQQQEAAHKAALESSQKGVTTQFSNSQQQETAEEYQERIQLQLQEDRLHEEIMREREEEIRNINRGMHQVNEIYKDLAHIVGSQQEQIDAIETQMEDARHNAESGLQQVEKANDKYGTTPNCCIS